LRSRLGLRLGGMLTAGALLAGCAGTAHHAASSSSGSSPSSDVSTSGPTTTTLPESTTTTVDPGGLPQTHVLPSNSSAAFAARMQSLWQAVVTGDPAPALPSFFPLSAYLQVKAISNAQSDWQNRLIGYYDLDIQAAHQLLGPDAASAEFVGVTLPTARAVWVLPGQEYNKGPYYRVYGTRLTYRVNGQTRSFGIFSLISWRGEWYVVHLGPSTRSSRRGIVYQPA
jgi:hypothetical protein